MHAYKVVFGSLLAITSILCWDLSAAGNSGRQIDRPICLVGLCANMNRNYFTDLRSFEGKYGIGAAPVEWVRCYADQESGLFLRLGVSGPEQYTKAKNMGEVVTSILLSDVEPCSSTRPLGRTLDQKLRTLRGLRVGDSEKRVLQLLGEPTKRSFRISKGVFAGLNESDEAKGNRTLGDQQWLFRPKDEDDSLTLQVFSRGGKVSAILLSLTP